MSDALKERLRERWLELSRSSFDSQDAGISANLIDDTIDRIEALEAQLAEARKALADINSWRDDTLGERPHMDTKYRNPDLDEAFDRGVRMAFYRCSDRARAALPKDSSDDQEINRTTPGRTEPSASGEQ